MRNDVQFMSGVIIFEIIGRKLVAAPGDGRAPGCTFCEKPCFFLELIGQANNRCGSNQFNKRKVVP
jgi:hypothetical protein